LLRTSSATYLTAQTTCSNLGGSLVQYRSRGEQLMVESTFTTSGMLPAVAYWIGLSRDAADAFWQYADSGTVQQTASNSPYAHWSYNMPTFSYDATKPTWNCIQVPCPCHPAHILPGLAGRPAADDSPLQLQIH
jgi:hypothetical protein